VEIVNKMKNIQERIKEEEEILNGISYDIEILSKKWFLTQAGKDNLEILKKYFELKEKFINEVKKLNGN